MSRRFRDGPLTDDDLASIIRAELEVADGADSDELDANRAEALKRYYGKPRGDERTARSKVLSTDLEDMVEAIVAEIGPALSTPGMLKFLPLGEQDEKQADLETAAVEKAIFQDCDGFRTIVTAVKEVLLLRACWAKVSRETDETTHTETLSGLTGEAVGMALQPEKRTESVELVTQEQIGEGIDGEPRFQITLKRTFTNEKLVIKPIPAENMRYGSDWRSTSIDGNRLVAEFERIERGDLLEMGVAQATVDRLPTSPVESRRTAVQRWTNRVLQAGGQEPSTELVDCYHVHLRVDADGDGRPELWYCLYAGEKVALKEEIPFPPYVNGTAILRAFRVDGISMYDRMRQIEDIKTGTLRQWMDNLSYMNNTCDGVIENQVNLGDYIRRAPGSYVRLKSANAIVPLGGVQDSGQSSRAMLDYTDKMRSERGGASLDLQSAEAQIAGHTMGGTERQYSSREKATKMMALTIGETFLRDLYRLVHRTMRTQSLAEVELKRNGEWQRTDPRTWKERTALKCSVGRTKQEHAARGAALQQVIAFQTTLLERGKDGILTDESKAHNALVDWCEANDLEAPEQYWIDPTSESAQKAAQQQAEQARAAKQAEEQANAALLRLTLSFERWKEEQENERHAMDVRFKHIEAALKSEQAEAEMIGKATTELELAQLRVASGGGGNGD